MTKKYKLVKLANKFQQNITKIDESEILEGNHFVLPYTQHLQYIFINLTKFCIKCTFNMYVKVD